MESGPGPGISSEPALLASLLGQIHQSEAIALARRIPDRAIDLVYCDPPFGKGREYAGRDNLAFDDLWASFDAYLEWLEDVAGEMPRILSDRGSFFLHLDPLASHYAKVILDRVFGRARFLNEIVWHHTGGGRSKRYFSRKHQVILWYSKSDSYTFNIDAVRQPYAPTSGYAKKGIRAASGKHYSPHPDGTPMDDVWSIPMVNPMAAERVGYPTQKPLALLERIVAAASSPGDVVGDFFCGSGTTLVAAKRLGRRWIGGDQSADAVAIARERIDREATCSPVL